jgi:hypothetical protein
MVVEKREDINWVGVFFQGLKPDMEKWLPRGTKPPVLYAAHAVDMLLWRLFPLENHKVVCGNSL